MDNGGQQPIEDVRAGISALGELGAVGVDLLISGIDEVDRAAAEALQHQDDYSQDEIGVIKDARGHFGDYREQAKGDRRDFLAAATAPELLTAVQAFGWLTNRVGEKARQVGRALKSAADRTAESATEAARVLQDGAVAVADGARDAAEKTVQAARTAAAWSRSENGRRSIGKATLVSVSVAGGIAAAPLSVPLGIFIGVGGTIGTIVLP